MVVPYAEAGHAGPISIAALEEILEVSFTRDSEHPFLAALRATAETMRARRSSHVA